METREIKFRSWDGKKYYYHNHLSGLYGVLVVESHQFTGLKDKNGVEIYEGDILIKIGIDHDSEEYETWRAGLFEGPEPEHKEIKRDVCTLDHFRYWLKNESFGYEGEDLESPDEWEIIGNKYEHPHLLNL